MLDMGSKVTDTILNDKFKIKCFLLLSLNLEVESYFSKFISSPLKPYTWSPMPFPSIIFPPQPETWECSGEQFIQVSTERKKKEADILFQETLLKGTLSQQKNFSVS